MQPLQVTPILPTQVHADTPVGGKKGSGLGLGVGFRGGKGSIPGVVNMRLTQSQGLINQRSSLITTPPLAADVMFRPAKWCLDELGASFILLFSVCLFLLTYQFLIIPYP